LKAVLTPHKRLFAKPRNRNWNVTEIAKVNVLLATWRAVFYFVAVENDASKVETFCYTILTIIGFYFFTNNVNSLPPLQLK